MLEENGIPICFAENYQGLPNINNAIDDKIFISWQDWRTGSASIYSQVVNYDGIIQLPENGTEIFGGLSGETYNLKILPNYHHIMVESAKEFRKQSKCWREK